jgi:O-antigen/teichoic acid export membrane protein
MLDAKKLFCKQKPLLKKAHAVAKGTGIVFIGTIIGTLLGFVSRIIIVRYITQTEYGIFSLALVLMSIFVTISMLGLQQGSTRYIACLLQRKERRKDF